MPSRIKWRGNSVLLTVVHKQVPYTKTLSDDNCPENQIEAETAWKLFAGEVIQGKALAAGTEKMTLKQFYAYWTENYADANHEDTTKVYNDDIFVRIDLALGHKRIDKILPKNILAFYKQISAPDVGKGDKPLKISVIKKYHTLLRTLFKDAQGWGFIVNNPMENIKSPKKNKNDKTVIAKKRILNEQEMTNLLDKLAQEPIKNQLWVLLAFSKGLRREEIFGLQWGDIDFENSTITIARAAVYVKGQGVKIKDTKSDSSYRVLKLPPDLADMIKLWRKELRRLVHQRHKRYKNAVGEIDPTGPDNFVFPKVHKTVSHGLEGTAGHPHAFNSFLKRLKENNSDLAAVSPHLLRHMSGSYLLNSKEVDIAAISAELGHSNKAFTMKTYIHELQSAKDQAASTMQGILNKLKPKKGQG